MKSFKVAVWSGSSLQNLGDRLLAAVTEEELRRRIPAIVLRHYCPWANGRHPAPLHINASGGWPGTGMFDAVVVAGGGVLAGPPFQHPVMATFCLGDHPELFDPRVKFAWNGVGLQDNCPDLAPESKAQGRWQRSYLKAFSQRATYLSVRDKTALSRLKAAEAAHAVLTPDPTFALPLSLYKSKAFRRKPRVGFMIGALGNSKIDTDNLKHLAPTATRNPEHVFRYESHLDADSYRNKNTAMHFFGICSAISQLNKSFEVNIVTANNIYGDQYFARSLALLFPDVRVQNIPIDIRSLGQITEIQEVFASYDVLVCSRFHSVILALRAGVRVIAVDPYKHLSGQPTKLADLLQQLGLEHRIWQPESIGLADLITSSLHDEHVEPARYEVQHRAAMHTFDEITQTLR
nr:polysaccharide pyruvyl transferase family protein [Caballeronia sp. GAFFF3]